MIASYVASVTVDISPWISCGLAMASVLLCLLLLAVMPDTSKSKHQLSHRAESSEADNDINEEDQTSKAPSPLTSISILHSALSNRNILLATPLFFVGIFKYTTLNVLIQYASVRFGLRVSTGATFYTETAVVNILLFLFFIPQVTTYIRKQYKVRPQVIDLFLVRTNVSLACIGALSIGLAQSGRILPIGMSMLWACRPSFPKLVLTLSGVAIFAAGFGSRVSTLSLVSYWISDDAKGTIYAAITVLESLGHAIGDPSMLQILAASLEFPPFWQALPFFVTAVSGCGAHTIWLLRIDFLTVNRGYISWRYFRRVLYVLGRLLKSKRGVL